MWFDIIKDNKRTKYYREFLEAATQLGDLIDSPDNITAYENYTGDKRPEYKDRGTAILYTYNFQFTATASIKQEMTFRKTGNDRKTTNNKQYNLFINKMFKTEYPELHNKIWNFALFFNKIVNPNLLGKEADKQRALFEGSKQSDNSMVLLKINLAHTYKFISHFLTLIRERSYSTLLSPSSFSLLPDNDRDRLRHIIDPTNVLVPLRKFVAQLSTFIRIEDTNETSTSFALKTALNRTYLKTVTDYIMENWVLIINTLRTDDAEVDGLNIPNIKTLQLGHKNPEGTEFYNRWLENYQELHEEEIEKYIEEIKNIPEEDIDSLFG